MTRMFELRPFDPHLASAEEWAAYHVFRRLRGEAEEPGEPIPDDADCEHELRRRGPRYERRRLIACVGREIVGLVGIGFRREGTPDAEEFAPFMFAWGGVLPRWRRRGAATILLGGALAVMRERDKRIMTIGTHLPEGRAFLTAIGGVEKNRNVMNRLWFDRLDWEELARWHAAAIPPSGNLRWEVHAGRVPLDRLAALLPRMSTLYGDVPRGTLDLPPPRYELPAYTAWYENMDQRGGEHLVVLLMDGEEIAGICEAGWNPSFPDRASQELTAVARPWRGKGLAKGLKAAMLRLVHARHPEVRAMSTENADGNAPILAINRRLGFVEYRCDSTFQVSRDSLEAWLAGRGQIH